MSTVDAGVTVPELVPARMVNEFAYCPRLFFLEWVQARFTDSVDTVEGRPAPARAVRAGGAGCWFSYGGWFSGMAEGLPSKHVELRRHQVALAGQGGLGIARRIVEGKIRNSRPCCGATPAAPGPWRPSPRSRSSRTRP